jgi:hypothetical protein
VEIEVAVNRICMLTMVGGVTVNDNVLLSFSCPLLSYFAMSLHTDRVRFLCVRVERERERERETQSASRERRTGEGEVRGKQETFPKQCDHFQYRFLPLLRLTSRVHPDGF